MVAKNKYWDGTAWQEVGASANKVTLIDNGNIINATDVEGALQEIKSAFDNNKAENAMYQKNGYGFNIDEGLRKWRVNSSNELLNVLILGDSISEGYNATNRDTEGYVALIKTKLQSIYGDGGKGFYHLLKSDFSFVGTWVALTELGPHGSCKYATGTGNTCSVTLDGDNFDIYVQGASNRGTFTVQVDAEDPVQITPTTLNVTEKHNVTALSNGTHTIVITAPVSGYVYLLGVSANIGTIGCRVHNVAKSGGVIGDIAYSYKKDFIVPINPDLTILAYTVNDYYTQTALATYKSRAELIIQKAQPYGSILLISSNQRNDVGVIPQKNYEMTLIELAKQYNCAFLSMYDRWQNYTTANSLGLMADTAHPTNKGHADQAKGILRHILET